MMKEFSEKPLRVFVVWEPVLATDWASPSTAALARLSDSRITQFWDKHRLVSHSMGEHDRRSVVWDYIAVYGAGSVWEESPPPALYHGNPVVKAIDVARGAVAEELARKQIDNSDHA